MFSYPYDRNIVFPASPANEILAAFLQLFLGPVATLNILMLLSYVLSGFFAFLLLNSLTRNSIASFIGGSIFAFSTPHLFDNLYNTSITYFLPLYVLAFARIRTVASKKNILLLFVSAIGLLSSSFYYAAYLGLLFFLLQFSYLIITRCDCRTLALVLAVNATAAGLVFPIYFNPFIVSDSEVRNALATYGAKGALAHSTDLLSYILPSHSHPLLAQPLKKYLSDIYVKAGLERGGSVYLGASGVTLLIFYILRVREKMKRFWLLLLVYSFLFSLGPVLRICGNSVFTGLPYLLFQHIPFLNYLRAPGRIYYLTSLALAVTAAYSLREIDGKLKKRRKRIILSSIIFFLILFENLYVFPYTTQNTSVPRFYHELQESKETFAIIQLPPGGFNLNRFFYYSYFSGKKTTSPLEVRPSQQSLEFVRKNRLLSVLMDYDYFASMEFSVDPIALDYSNEIDEFKNLNIRYVILHKNNICSNYLVNTLEEDQMIVRHYEQFLASLPFLKVYEDEDVVVYSIAEGGI